MAKLNLLNTVQIYRDASPTNNPLQTTANWHSSVMGAEVSEPQTKELIVPAQQTEVLFSGVVTTENDGTTSFSIEKKEGVSNTYIVSTAAGTPAVFRENRDLQIDSGTSVTVTKSGALMTLTFSGPHNLSTLQFGDILRIERELDLTNRGDFTVLSFDADSVTVSNIVATPQTANLVDGDEIKAFSAAGVQVGQKVRLGTGFAGYSQGVYEITGVGSEYLEINTSKMLPPETSLGELVVYRNSKNFVYIEFNQECSLTINGIERSGLKPLQYGAKKASGFFMETGDVYEISVKNQSVSSMNIVVITAE